ncbi:LisH domain-containing protein armc9 [Nowakowskiella sp. JEL0407]|nr:LisH domain-containing protein armc9 [Nowakowskiella sp. JEL0407]
MEQFKNFLETRGSELCKTTQYLSFYALPYVPDPRTHPSFQEIFTKEWVEETEGRMQQLISTSLQNNVPRILKFVNNPDLNSSEETKRDHGEYLENKTRFRDLELHERELNIKHRKLQNDYHNLITIATELVQALAASVSGEQITPKYLSSIAQRLASFKKKNPDATTPPPIMENSHQQQRTNIHSAYEISHHDQHKKNNPIRKTQSSTISRSHHSHAPAPITQELPPQIEMKTQEKRKEILNRMNSISKKEAAEYNDKEQTNSENSRNLQDLRAEDYDYQKISNDLIPGNQSFYDQEVLLKSAHKLLAPQLIRSSKNNLDILGFKANLPKKIFKQSKDRVKLQFVTLANFMASFSVGREYILTAGRDFFVVSLADELINCIEESGYRQNLLATLQKLSLRRSVQTMLNNKSIITFLLKLLYENIDSLSEYTIEYSSAMLMNLCLRTLGKKECKKNYSGLFKVLNSLLEMEDFQVKTYAHGILYSLFSDAEIRQEALEFGMDEILNFLKNQYKDAGLIGQIDFVINQLNSNENSTIFDEASEDGIDEDETESLEYDDLENVITDDASDVSDKNDYSHSQAANILHKYLKSPQSRSYPDTTETEKALTIARITTSRHVSLSLSNPNYKISNEPYTRPITPMSHLKPKSYQQIRAVTPTRQFLDSRTRTPATEEKIIQTFPHTQRNEIQKKGGMIKSNNGLYSNDELQVAFASREKVVRTPIPFLNQTPMSSTALAAEENSVFRGIRRRDTPLPINRPVSSSAGSMRMVRAPSRLSQISNER